MEFYPTLLIKLQTLQDVATVEKDKCYIVLKLGTQSFNSSTFHIKENIEISQNFEVKFTHSKAILFIYRKSLITADFLVGQGVITLEAEQFGNYFVKMHNQNTNEYIATLSIQATLQTQGSAIDSLFSVIPEKHQNRGLSPIKMGDYFRQFVIAITPLAKIRSFLLEIYA